MQAKLYVILGSHACRTGMLLLEHKGIPYRTVTLPTGLHPMAVRLRGFPGSPAPFRQIEGRNHRWLRMADRMGTVPAIRIDGQRVQRNREIARFLEELKPDPPLFPADPGLRRRVEEAEAWGDDIFQMAARRLAIGAVFHDPDAMVNRGDNGRLGPLLVRNASVRRAGVRLLAPFFRVDPDVDRKLLASLPAVLDRIDGWIEAGVLNGADLNAADLMIAPSLALLTYRRDLRPQIEARPAVALIDRLLPEPA